MPAAKPSTLTGRHSTRAERTARTDAESAITPRTVLTLRVPAVLTGHAAAVATWKHTVKLYREIEGTIVTAFDEGILVDYCLLVDQLVELENLRTDSFKSAAIIRKSLNEIISKTKKKDAKTILAEQLAIGEKLEDILGMIIKLDGRIDRKRSLIHTLRQSLYLTPRSRAGVAPPEKKEELKDEMSQLLDDIAE